MSEDCGQYVASKDITLGVAVPHVLVGRNGVRGIWDYGVRRGKGTVV